EWDWAVTPVNADGLTQYYFRMAYASGDAFGAYAQYPTVTTAAATLSQTGFRLYENVDGLDPAVAIAGESSLYSGSVDGDAYHLRIALSANFPVPGGDTFKLQFAESDAGPWTDVGAPGSGELWRGVDNAAPDDGDPLVNAFLAGVSA